MKACRGCQQEKSNEDYYWLGPKKNCFSTRCKQCDAKYKKASYQKHREKRIAQSANRKKLFLLEFRKFKEKPCIDCSIQYHPAAMHWHHKPGLPKVNNVGTLVNQGKREAALAEIAKCELLCANCHAVRTWGSLYNSLEEDVHWDE